MRAILSLFHHGYSMADYRQLLRGAGRPRRAMQYLFERIAHWTILTALTALAFEVAGGEGAALLILAYVLPRALLSGARLDGLVNRLGWWVFVLPIPFALALLLTAPGAELALLMLLMLPLGVLNVLSDKTVDIHVDRQQSAVAGAFLGRIEQVALIAGALLAGAALKAGDAAMALGMAVALLVLAALLAWPDRARAAEPRARPGADETSQAHSAATGQTLGLLVLGLFLAALAAMTTRVALIGHVVDGLGHTDVIYACLIAVLGVGALVGPLSMPKLLSHLSAAPTVTLLAGALGCTVIALSRNTPIPILAAALFAAGLLSVTLDLVAGTLSRRIVPAPLLGAAALVLARAVVAGQLAGLAGTLALARFLSAGQVLLAVGLLCVAASAAALVLAPKLGWRRLAVRA